MAYGPNSGVVPFTGFTPTLGVGQTALPVVAGEVAFNGMSQADEKLSSFLRRRGNRNLYKILNALMGVASTTEVTAVHAEGYIRFDANASDADTITLNGTAITFKNSPGAGQVQIGASVADTLDALLIILEASVDAEVVKFTYAVQDPYLLIYAAASGTGGNSLTIAASNASHVESGATLAGGVAGVTADAVTETFSRVDGTPVRNQQQEGGGLVTIESATGVSVSKSTANKTRLLAAMSRTNFPSTYATDRSGNGAGKIAGW